MEDFIITKFNNIISTKNTAGNAFELKKRYCSCFIVTFSGRIRFSYSDGSIEADSEHPVFIPEGLTYRNECLEDAVSLVFNFYTQKEYTKPTTLSPISHIFAKEKFEEIEKASLSNTAENKMTVLCALYALASRFFAFSEKSSFGDVVVDKAMEYIRTNYGKCDLSVSQVAREVFISEVYLRKLFIKKMNMTPSRYILDIRMKRARDLAREKIPVKEIARLVGYADIYQFSRAYKKLFGYAPSKTVWSDYIE